MLRVGRDRLLDRGIVAPALLCDAEKIPFPDNYFDVVTVAFGLRNMTHKEVALSEMRRVLKPGGRLLVLEFSKVWQPLKKAYDVYSFKVLPWLGDKFAKDAGKLPLSCRVDPNASGSGNAENNDGAGRTRRRRILQFVSWRGSLARGGEVLAPLTTCFYKEYRHDRFASSFFQTPFNAV